MAKKEEETSEQVEDKKSSIVEESPILINEEKKIEETAESTTKEEINPKKTSSRDLHQIDIEKEKFFADKERLSKEVAEKIDLIKSLKRKRDDLTRSVRGLKEERKKLNTEIRDQINEFKKIAPKKGERRPGRDSFVNARKLKYEIEKLEEKVETEALSFDKEKKVNDIIKQKKKQLKEFGAISENFEKTRALSREIEKIKKNADQKHKEIQEKANKSQELHIQILKISKEVDTLKEDRDRSHDRFIELKKEFVALSNIQRDKAAKNKARSQKSKKERREKTQKKNEEIVKEKSQEVKEKIKKKAKLTTEDLLVMQQLSDEEIDKNIKASKK